ncbi:charged multivesicular body protein 2b [Chrysoperla carnea]|uniref:charged multivesicular body protein 2b n=1 Tax=Chrysoperla carnea TaxID=189513 RepID=UPI001D098FAA|nr:charged multivesicular body protein 2b [Chrysoperla carnea]
MFNFFSKPDPKEQQRQADRALRKAGRDIERDQQKLENEEKKLELEIKRAAKEGNNDACRILAKQLIELRKQKNRNLAARGKIQSVGVQNKNMVANAKLANIMGTTSKTMGDMNKIMNPEKIGRDLSTFSREAMKMDMTEEMINDTLDDMLTESGDEEESTNIVSQVLDEIGIEISGKMKDAPTPSGKIGATDSQIEAQLAKLKMPE